MSFWDSSAILPLLIWEQETAAREEQLRADGLMLVWWGSRLECCSALRRREREASITADDVKHALARLDFLSRTWNEVAPNDFVRSRAERLLGLHALRAADALQLAAALVACVERTAGAIFLTSDARLAAAAGREGFMVQ